MTLSHDNTIVIILVSIFTSTIIAAEESRNLESAVEEIADDLSKVLSSEAWINPEILAQTSQIIERINQLFNGTRSTAAAPSRRYSVEEDLIDRHVNSSAELLFKQLLMDILEKNYSFEKTHQDLTRTKPEERTYHISNPEVIEKYQKDRRPRDGPRLKRYKQNLKRYLDNLRKNFISNPEVEPANKYAAAISKTIFRNSIDNKDELNFFSAETKSIERYEINKRKENYDYNKNNGQRPSKENEFDEVEDKGIDGKVSNGELEKERKNEHKQEDEANDWGITKKYDWDEIEKPNKKQNKRDNLAKLQKTKQKHIESVKNINKNTDWNKPDTPFDHLQSGFKSEKDRRGDDIEPRNKIQNNDWKIDSSLNSVLDSKVQKNKHTVYNKPKKYINKNSEWNTPNDNLNAKSFFEGNDRIQSSNRIKTKPKIKPDDNWDTITNTWYTTRKRDLSRRSKNNFDDFKFKVTPRMSFENPRVRETGQRDRDRKGYGRGKSFGRTPAAIMGKRGVYDER